MDDRKIEVFIDGEWERCELRQLLPGALFRMFEPDGHPVKDHKGRTEFTVTARAKKVVAEGRKTWSIEVQD